jgi:hypothetical protein
MAAGTTGGWISVLVLDFKDRTAEPWIWAILGPSPHHEKHECYIYSDLVWLYTYINKKNNNNNMFMMIII